MGELGERGMIIEHVFKQYDKHGRGELSALDIQMLHGDLRMGGISYPQVLASMKYVCSTDSCSVEELCDLLQEMDRRYFLLQDLRWEFSLLDRDRRDTITIEQARWMVQAMHGKNFSRRKWAQFLQKRAVPGSHVAFSEIEVLLCNVKSSLDVIQDREDDERERREQLERERLAEEEARKERERLQRQKEEDKRRRDEEVQRFLEALRRTPDHHEVYVDHDCGPFDPPVTKHGSQSETSDAVKATDDSDKERERQEEEARRRMMEEEELRRKEQLMRENEELRRLKELEEKNKEEEERRRREEMEKYKDAEQNLEDVERLIRELEEELKRIRQLLKDEKDEKRRRELEEEEERIKQQLHELKHRRIRYSLKVAIKEKDRYKLEYSINEFKVEKLEDKDMDLERAERLLKELVSRDNLRRAISKREIEELEQAINVIKKHGLEAQLSKELFEANLILARLRKIQRIRSEILELKQSTVAEIRSYQNPPPVVHQVMTATFLILGHHEKETKNWKTVQALVGKTGKEGLKRRCLECDASKIPMEAAKRAKVLLDKHELDEVRDVSAGAATFYVFSVAMVEECFDIAERGPMEPEPSAADQAEKKPPGVMRPRVDPTKMVISRSKQMVTTSGPGRARSKTPPARKK